MDLTYTSMLASLNVGSAHPGGLSATKEVWQKIKHFPFKTILDAGCGTGQTLKYLSTVSNARLIGVDHHPTMIKKAKDHLQDKDVELILADLQALPLADESVDCIFSESVTSFNQIDSLLAEFHRVLRTEGVLYFNEICTADLLSQDERSDLNQFYGTKQILTKSEWLDNIDASAFDVLDTRVIPPSRSGKVDIELNSDTDQIDIEFLTYHFQTIEKLKNKLIGLQIICQKKVHKEVDDANHSN